MTESTNASDPEVVPQPVAATAKTGAPAPLANSSMDEVAHQLKVLNSHLSRKTSLKFLFAAALLQGLGYLLGATLVASILVAISVRFLGSLNLPSMFQDLVQSAVMPGSAQEVNFKQYPF